MPIAGPEERNIPTHGCSYSTKQLFLWQADYLGMFLDVAIFSVKSGTASTVKSDVLQGWRASSSAGYPKDDATVWLGWLVRIVYPQIF